MTRARLSQDAVRRYDAALREHVEHEAGLRLTPQPFTHDPSTDTITFHRPGGDVVITQEAIAAIETWLALPATGRAEFIRERKAVWMRPGFRAPRADHAAADVLAALSATGAG